jgi:hypothetical protein
VEGLNLASISLAADPGINQQSPLTGSYHPTDEHATGLTARRTAPQQDVVVHSELLRPVLAAVETNIHSPRAVPMFD